MCNIADHPPPIFFLRLQAVVFFQLLMLHTTATYYLLRMYNINFSIPPPPLSLDRFPFLSLVLTERPGPLPGEPSTAMGG